MRGGTIVNDFEILKPEAVDRFGYAVQNQFGQGCRGSPDLLTRLIEMIGIEMRITKRVNKIAGLKVTNGGNHMGQQGVGRNIERHAQKTIGTALKKLA